MLKARKRITKKKLKEDKLVTYVGKLSIYLEKDWKKLAAIVASAIVIYAAVYLMNQSNIQSENLASREFYGMENRYFAGMLDSSLVAGLQDFLTRHKDTKSGANATMYLANTHFQLGNYMDAETYYRKYLDDYGGADFMKASAQAGIAACFETRNMFKEASDNYLEAIRQYPNVFTKPELMLGAARTLFSTGNLGEARSQCEKIIDEYPASQQSIAAQVLLAKM